MPSTRFSSPFAMCMGLFLCLSVLMADVSFGQAQPTPSRKRFLKWAYQDVGAWVNSIDRQRILQSAAGVAILIPISFLDEDISERAASWDKGLFGDFLDGANNLGEPIALLFPASIFALSLVTDNARFQDAAFTGIQAPLYANMLTFMTKYTLGRARPEEGQGAHHFDLFGGSTAFPSGHATTAFAFLTTWVFYYPSVVTYSLLIVAVGTAIARLQRQKHWFTDIVAGSFNGTAMAYFLSRHHQGKMSNLSLNPAIGPGNVGMTMSLSF